MDIDVSADVFRNIVDQHFCGDFDRVIHLYYDRLLRMVELGGFDILGHADKMHTMQHVIAPVCWTSLGTMSWLHGYFSDVAANGYIVEVNTKA